MLLAMQSEGGFGSVVLNVLLSVIAILPEIDRAMEQKKEYMSMGIEPRSRRVTRNVGL